MVTFIDKRQVRQLFGGASKTTIDRWVKTGELPKPTTKFFRQQWNYEDLLKLLKLKRLEKNFE